MAALQVRIDDNLKAKSDALFSSLGLDTSTAIRMFLTMSVEKNGLPFAVQHSTNYSLKQAMLDSENLTNLSGPFKSAKEAVTSMLED